jgi:hypothetical protein
MGCWRCSSILARDLESAVLYKENGEFAGVRRPDSGKTIEVEGITIVLKDIIGSTGLELKVRHLVALDICSPSLPPSPSAAVC